MKRKDPLQELLRVMARLRSPKGCPWDLEQDHRSIRHHAIEEVYELIDAIESGDDQEIVEELGDLLLQVVFHCQMARERKAFDFDTVAAHLVEKLIRRHPHVFGDKKTRSIAGIWAQWERIKRAEKQGTHRARKSAFDGIPRHLPALLRAEKLIKKALRAGLPLPEFAGKHSGIQRPVTRRRLAQQLFSLVAVAQAKGWSAEEMVREISVQREKDWRTREGSVPSTPSA